MQLKYKISTSILIVSLSILVTVLYLYSVFSYRDIMNYEKTVLVDHAEESSRFLESILVDKLTSAITLSTAPIVVETLQLNHTDCDALSVDENHEQNKLNNIKWKSARNAEDSFVKPFLNNKLALFLKEQQIAFPGAYGELFITNKHGTLVAATAKLTTFTHETKYWWKEAYADGLGKVFFDDRGFDTSANDYVIGIVLPIRHKGEVIGILKANVNISNTLSDIVNLYSKTNHGELKIVRTKGLIVYEKGKPALSSTIYPDILNVLQGKKLGMKVVKEKEKTLLVSYAPLEISYMGENISFGGKPATSGSMQGADEEIWHTVISYDEKLALEDIVDTRMQIIYIGLVITFISVTLAFLIGRWISYPIEALVKSQEKLREQEEVMISQSRHAAMGEMISMIAHQWRQPLSVLTAEANNILIDIELGKVEEDELRISVEGITKTAQELSHTIEDFRNFFKFEKETTDVNIKDIFNDVFSVIEKSMGPHNIELVFDFQSVKKVKTYARELMQVCINLVQNSQDAIIEHSSNGGTIYISSEDTPDGVLIRICDTGKGIDSQAMNHIFEPYYTTKDEKNGTGLGLYMSKEIIKEHLGGSIVVYNTDEGACFEIGLPTDWHVTTLPKE